MPRSYMCKAMQVIMCAEGQPDIVSPFEVL